MAKMLANRLKGILPLITSQEQSAFVPGRQILDNVMLSFEYLHSLRKKTNGKMGLMALKMDISKAYDRVEWPFLISIMVKMGFTQRWIDRIMNYIYSSELSILVNGQSTPSFKTNRGLRQGCPLAPYLFLLCSEWLAGLLKQQVTSNRFKGVQCTRTSPIISHLFFADDSLILGSADIQNCNIIRDTLSMYAEASGQMINLQKSSITFNPNMTSTQKAQVFQILGMPPNESRELYLGLPTFVGRSKNKVFDGVKQRIFKKLQTWRSNLFSMAGREVLIKAVAQATSSYTMCL